MQSKYGLINNPLWWIIFQRCPCQDGTGTKNQNDSVVVRELKKRFIMNIIRNVIEILSIFVCCGWSLAWCISQPSSLFYQPFPFSLTWLFSSLQLFPYLLLHLPLLFRLSLLLFSSLSPHTLRLLLNLHTRLFLEYLCLNHQLLIWLWNYNK